MRINRTSVCLGAVVAFLLMPSPGTAAIRLVFRLDDDCTGAPLQLVGTLVSVFQDERVPLTVGVVPAVAADGNLNSTGVVDAVIKGTARDRLLGWIEAGAVEPAVHGWEHRNHSTGDCARSEFAGSEPALQFYRMSNACHAFGDNTGLRPKIFLPPWNAFDIATLRVAVSNGIGIVSATDAVPRERDAVTDGLTFLPVCDKRGDLKRVIADARRRGLRPPVLSHPMTV